MKNHIRQSLFINNLLHLITQIAVSDRKTKGRSHDQVIILILTAKNILSFILFLFDIDQDLCHKFRNIYLPLTGIRLRCFQ